MLKVNLPWPEKILWPNRNRGHHWSEVRKAAVKAHQYGLVTVAKQIESSEVVESSPDAWQATVEFHPPTHHRYDLDNALASLKAYLDGMMEALAIDDSQIVTVTLCKREVVSGGVVIVTLQPE